MWGLPLELWGLWLVLVGAMILVGCAAAAWGADGRKPPPPLERRPLPRPRDAPRQVPKHAQWTRRDGALGGETTNLGWAAKPEARAQVFPAPMAEETGHEDDVVFRWPGDR